MRTIVKTINVFKFNELSKELQQKAKEREYEVFWACGIVGQYLEDDYRYTGDYDEFVDDGLTLDYSIGNYDGTDYVCLNGELSIGLVEKLLKGRVHTNRIKKLTRLLSDNGIAFKSDYSRYRSRYSVARVEAVGFFNDEDDTKANHRFIIDIGNILNEVVDAKLEPLRKYADDLLVVDNVISDDFFEENGVEFLEDGTVYQD